MKVVQTYGRKQDYNFGNDENLWMILNGPFGPQGKVNRNQVTIAYDSFLTIYLVTLPEKFKQWYNLHQAGITNDYVPTEKMDLGRFPVFPRFERESYWTKLSPRQGVTDDYGYLPLTWNLLECFEYYFIQTELWTTRSILEECERTLNLASRAVVDPENAEYNNDEEDGKKGGTKTNDGEENVPGANPEKVAGAIDMKSPDNVEDTGKKVGQGIARRKRSLSEDSSVPPGSSTKKKRKKSTTEEQVINAEASRYIFALGPALSNCMGMLEDLMLAANSMKAKSKIQSIQDRLNEVVQIKRKLVSFAMNNRA